MLTLNLIRSKSPYEEGWIKLLINLNKTQGDDEPLNLLTILNSNGLEDTLWVLTQTDCDERLSRHFSAWCAEQVIHNFELQHPNDPRPREAINLKRDDSASREQRVAAQAAAVAAVVAATQAAAVAAVVAATQAAVAARSAARAAADLAAEYAAMVAARSAAYSLADLAAWTAARSAARAAADPAAEYAARVAQTEQLRKMLTWGF